MMRRRNYTRQESQSVKALENRLAMETERILSSEANWKHFLTTAARFVHYPFHNQVLIHAQNPKSLGVATFHVWSNRCGLKVSTGTHGFPVIKDLEADNPQIITLHDRENVEERDRVHKIPPVWEFPTADVAELADRICGKTYETDNSPELRIWKWLGSLIEETDAQDVLDDCERKSCGLDKDPSIHADEMITDAEYLKNWMHVNVAYEVFTRCNLNVDLCDSWNKNLMKGNPYTLQSLFESDEEAIGFFADGFTRSAKSAFAIIRKGCRNLEQDRFLKAQKERREEKAEPVPVIQEEAEKAEPVPVIQEEAEKAESVPVIQEEAEKAESVPVVQEEKKGSKPDNYKITDMKLGEGGLKEKFRNNLLAIQVLHTLERENRYASAQEQEILSKYVGWGGLADAFDDTKENWHTEYEQLKAELSLEEYRSARGSVLNAHYTAPAVIQNMYQILGNLGYKTGNILEPACGTGNFIGMLPTEMENSQMFGVELDQVSGQIAKELYPESNITIQGFEKNIFPDNYFDVVIGNVPFGDYKVSDRKYDRYNFMIHDYFIAKGIDQLRPGGIMAVITSAGTLDKLNPSARKYFADRANLLGAIRLPDNAFMANAGTRVMTDILVFQKAVDGQVEVNPSWLKVETNNRTGLTYNRYFQENPEMVLGHLENESGPYGMRLTCKASATDLPLADSLREAASHIRGHISDVKNDEIDRDANEAERLSIPADPNVKNYSYTVVDGTVYYRRDSIMERKDSMDAQKVAAYIALKDAGYQLLDMELSDKPEDQILQKMKELNEQYDGFKEAYGLLSAKGNRSLNEDASFGLVGAFEQYDDKGNYTGKADIFSKRVVTPRLHIEKADNVQDALLVSLEEKGHVDIPYMAGLLENELAPEEVVVRLHGTVYRDPEQAGDDLYSGYVTADEYLSGNIRKKLQAAEKAVEEDPSYQDNLEALKKAIPEPLKAEEIDVHLGSTWVKPEYVEQFIEENFKAPAWMFTGNSSRGDRVRVTFEPNTAEWNIANKGLGNGPFIPLASTKFGTERKNGLEILENTLNLRDTKVYDRIVDADGTEKSVINKKETALCSAKAEFLKSEFSSWIFRDPLRRADLVETYNERFNSFKNRSYDGSFLHFPAMNPEIHLRDHQKNAVARSLFGQNELLAHVVGAGKTYTMVASAMESKRIGLSHKALFVVPNHLTEQWGTDFLKLYPSANVLVATKADFTPDKRKLFCAKIATGDYDAVIIGHSQFEKIPLSAPRQASYIQKQIDEITSSIQEAKLNRSERFTIKQLEKTEKKLKTRLEKLNSIKKDDVVTFEQLGVDRLYVDESHYYKNLFLYTKMSNVAGVQQTEAAKSSDMYMKCQYMNELTGGRGIVFATGTPISNSMTELYTNMRYLQSDLLKEYELDQFDAWAANFGNVVSAVELAPEGVGYRAKKRFSSFSNIPELMKLWHQAADVQTSDMLNLPVPEAEIVNVQTQPTQLQRDMVAALADRADAVRNHQVEPNVDNMLKITNDGRKLALDQRLIHPDMPDIANSKVNACVDMAYSIWKDTEAERATQLIFCDLSTPKGDGTFNVYDDVRSKLLEKGVPEEEIAFIHEAKTELQKERLFKRVRSGEVRLLMGSTLKMGAGTNVQDRLIALHHLDVPWRPSDIEQREGRIIRQGNLNPKVRIFRYVTADTFDAYSWQLIENKQKFISQIMTAKSPMRKCADIDESALSYAEVKALATGNPFIREKMELDVEVAKLRIERSAYESELYRLQDDVQLRLPKRIATLQERIDGLREDIRRYEGNKPQDPEQFSINLDGTVYTDRKEAGEALRQLVLKKCSMFDQEVEIGSYLGFKLKAEMWREFATIKYTLNLSGYGAHRFDLSASNSANITSMTRVLNGMQANLEKAEKELAGSKQSLETESEQLSRPFEKESLYQSSLARLQELDAMLDISENADSELAVTADDQPETASNDDAEKIESWELFENYDAADLDHDYQEDSLPDPVISKAAKIGHGEEKTNDPKQNYLQNSPEESVQDPSITFYAAEVVEFPDMGELHTGLTLDEAIQAYRMMNSSQNGVKGIGFELHDGSIYDGMRYSMMAGDKILTDDINMVEHFKNSTLVQHSMEELEEQLADTGKTEVQEIQEKTGNLSMEDDKAFFGKIALQRSKYHDREELFFDVKDAFDLELDQVKADHTLIAQELLDKNAFIRDMALAIDRQTNWNSVGDQLVGYYAEEVAAYRNQNYIPESNPVYKKQHEMAASVYSWEQSHGIAHDQAATERNEHSGQILFREGKDQELSDRWNAVLAERKGILSNTDQDKKYILEFTGIGNGITAWNRAEPIFEQPYDQKHTVKDYKTLAYISPDGQNITYFTDQKELPENVVQEIETEAARQAQRYNPDTILLRSLQVDHDLRNQGAKALLERVGENMQNVRFCTEGIHRYNRNHGIDSGDLYSSGLTQRKSAFETYVDMDEMHLETTNIYAIYKEPSGKEQVYLIDTEQLNAIARKEFVAYYGQNGVLTEPQVYIHYSESIMFREGSVLPLHEANALFEGYDKAQNELRNISFTEGNPFGYYHKTKFSLITDNGEYLGNYIGRYDLGDLDGDLLHHMNELQKSYAKYSLYKTTADLTYGDGAMEEAYAYFTTHMLPELETYLQYEIVPAETGNWHIVDRFKRNEEKGGFGKAVLDPDTGFEKQFQTPEQAKRYLEAELNTKVEFQGKHHASQYKAAYEADQEYRKEAFNQAWKYRDPNRNEEELLKAALCQGFVKNQKGTFDKLDPFAFAFELKNVTYGFERTEGGYNTLSFMKTVERVRMNIVETGTEQNPDLYQIANDFLDQMEVKPSQITKVLSPEEIAKLKIKAIQKDDLEFRIDKKVQNLSEKQKKNPKTQVSEKTPVKPEMVSLEKTKRFDYVCDGKTVAAQVSLSEAMGRMLKDKVFKSGKQYEIILETEDSSVLVAQGNQKEVVIPVSKINSEVDLNANQDLKENIRAMVDKAGSAVKVDDPYNQLDRPMDAYKKSQETNIWKNPEMVYSAVLGQQISAQHKEQLHELNEKAGYFMKNDDLKLLAEGKSPIHKSLKVSEKMQKTAKQLCTELVEPFEAKNDFLKQEERIQREEITIIDTVDVSPM